MIKKITSTKDPLICETALLQKTGDENAYLLEGEKFIADTSPDDILRLFSTDEDVCARYGLVIGEVYSVPQFVLNKLSGAVSESRMIAVVKKREVKRPEKLLLLDCIQDPGNVGTMIRTALAFGFGIVCGEGTANPFLPKTVRSSAGALCKAFVIRRELCGYISSLKSDGFTVIGSALDENAYPASDEKLPAALVIGSEGRGMAQETRELCDKFFYIPIQNVESLNAAVAAGIMMEKFRK